jgi:hypothetical protein
MIFSIVITLVHFVIWRHGEIKDFILQYFKGIYLINVPFINYDMPVT